MKQRTKYILLITLMVVLFAAAMVGYRLLSVRHNPPDDAPYAASVSYGDDA